MISSRWWLLIAGITAVACSLGSQFPQRSVESKMIEIQSPVAINSVIITEQQGISLRIPKIGVEAALRPVGLTIDGAMIAPVGPADVVWFEPGPRPGEVGSSVIAGHFGWKNGIPAAFDSLNKLSKGDKIYIKDGKSEPIVFTVNEVRAYGEKENAADVFLSTDKKAHLNLITCFGSWNKKGKSYSDRLVVFADKEI